MLAVLADEHVDAALLGALRTRGIDAVSIPERRLQGLADEDVLTLALQEQRVVLTCDTDFLRLSHALQSRQAMFAPIIWWPQQSRTIAELLAKIIPLLQTGDYTASCSRQFFA